MLTIDQSIVWLSGRR